MSVEKKSERILVAMSGGIDSAVAALLLKEEGFAVTGLTIRLWVDPQAAIRAQGGDTVATTVDPVAEARRVADFLDIPHRCLDMSETFYQTVVHSFVEAYLNGKTPNPCIECNRAIKFAALLEQAHVLGMDRIATGHYAQVTYDAANDRYRLLKGKDRHKDQSYMLYNLGQKALSSTVFPLGELQKEEVRSIALHHCLPVAAKEESQDICFIPDCDYRSFLERERPEAIRPGDIVSTTGAKLGEHRGLAFYTIGQRKGLGLTAPKPLYVIGLDVSNNQIIVGSEEETFTQKMVVEKLNLISAPSLDSSMEVEVKIRYRTPAVPAIVYPPREGFTRVDFLQKQKAITPGQSAVFYRHDEVVGGGIIAFDRLKDLEWFE